MDTMEFHNSATSGTCTFCDYRKISLYAYKKGMATRRIDIVIYSQDAVRRDGDIDMTRLSGTLKET